MGHGTHTANDRKRPEGQEEMPAQWSSDKTEIVKQVVFVR